MDWYDWDEKPKKDKELEQLIADLTARALKFKGDLNRRGFEDLTALYDQCCVEYRRGGRLELKLMAEELLQRMIKYMNTRK